MKYEVTFSCGHTGTVQLYGKGDERERKIRYFEEYGVCSECYKERRAIEAEIGCKHVTMFYRTYKTDYSFCDVPVMATVKKPTQPKMQSLPGYK